MSITLMSYNTLSCRKFDTHEFDFDSFVEVIRRHNADIVGLNEIRDKGVDEGYQAQAKLLGADLTGVGAYSGDAKITKGGSDGGEIIGSV